MPFGPGARKSRFLKAPPAVSGIDEWQRAHLENPRDLVPESNMPGYPWLSRTMLNPKDIEPKMRVLRTLGAPYSDEEIAGAQNEVTDKTEQDAMVAYLQVLGTAIKSKN
jgi:cytochrome c oxidase cbb3-type subunit 2